MRGRDDRRALRRLTGGACLLLAFACLVAAGAALSAHPGGLGMLPSAGRVWSRVPLSLLLAGFVFLVVFAAALRRGRRRDAGARAASRQP